MKEFFRVGFQSSNIDKENMIIFGARIAAKIPPKDDRNIRIDDQFISDFLSKTKGDLPMEADHSYFSRVGSKLAFLKNIRSDENGLLGDIHFLKSAEDSPINPKMPSFLMNSIEENPKSYMLSMKVNVEYFFAAADKRPVSRRFNWETGNFEWYYTDNKKSYTGIVNMKFQKCTGVDFVSDGGLTNSMFASEDQVDDFITMFNEMTTDPSVSKILQENFHRLEISGLKTGPEVKKGFLDYFKTILNMNDSTQENPTPTTTTQENHSTTPPATATTQEFVTKADFEAFTKRMEEMLKPQPPTPDKPVENFAAEHASGSASTAEGTKVPEYYNSEINKRARRNYEAKQSA